jgi:hypothetical protein
MGMMIDEPIQQTVIDEPEALVIGDWSIPLEPSNPLVWIVVIGALCLLAYVAYLKWGKK